MINDIKNIILPGISACLLILNACSKDFLEKPDSSDVTIDTIFSTKIKAETFLWETYGTSISGGLPRDWGRWEGVKDASMLMAACDEGDVYDEWPGSNLFNTGVWGPQSIPEDGFGPHYKAIRNANIFIANIDRVVDMSDTERSQMRAEAIFLRALQHAELLKRYGGIPIVDQVLRADGDVKLPRNTYAECVDFIVRSCDEAAAVLPNGYPTAFLGRITRGAALALKSRVLLYAASPLANSATPYMSQDRQYTGYTDYDPSRWMRAAEAAKAVLDWAAIGGIRLITDSENPGAAYETATTDPDNAEIILADKSVSWWGAWWPLTFQFVMPRGIYAGWYGHGVTLQHALKYYKKDGTDQQWPSEGTYQEFVNKMAAMEPRFQRSVFYSGSKFNDEYGVRDFYKRSNGAWTDHAPVNGVGYMKKFLTKFNWNGGRFNWPIFRLAEFYLNYAEALNEASPMASDSYAALNTIRRRAGIPEVSSGDQRYNSQEKLRETIRRERAIELAFEEHRYWDVRRWQIAQQEGVMRGAMYGLNLYQLADGSIVYRKEVFENRVWDNKMYVYPIPQAEFDKGYISQTPGW